MHPETYTASSVDNTPYESKWKGLDRPTFPYDLAALAEANGGADIIKGTPMGNDLLVDFGLAAITAHGLGEDELPDVLALSFSSTDYVGHQFGAHAMETEDTYRRLDDALDPALRRAGRPRRQGRMDGLPDRRSRGCHRPRTREKARGLPVDYWNPEPMKARVDTAIARRYGRTDLILTYDNDQFFFDRPLLLEAGLDLDEVARFVAGVAETTPEVQRVLTGAKTFGSAHSTKARKPMCFAAGTPRCPAT